MYFTTFTKHHPMYNKPILSSGKLLVMRAQQTQKKASSQDGLQMRATTIHSLYRCKIPFYDNLFIISLLDVSTYVSKQQLYNLHFHASLIDWMLRIFECVFKCSEMLVWFSAYIYVYIIISFSLFPILLGTRTPHRFWIFFRISITRSYPHSFHFQMRSATRQRVIGGNADESHLSSLINYARLHIILSYFLLGSCQRANKL